MKPTIGRIVHYVNTYSEWPAIVTQVHEDNIVNLQAFANDNGGMVFLTRIRYNEQKLTCTWHWPEREE